MTPASGKLRRPGYAPSARPDVGRRGLHTRDRILTCSSEVFLANGFHGTSIEMIAKAAGASRATIYQYFADKDDVFRELANASEQALCEHGERLGRLEPTADGLRDLTRWMHGWADVYDAHTAVFAEYPARTVGPSILDRESVTETFRHPVADRLRAATVRGLQLGDATAALMRIPHMVNLYRYRRIFELPRREAVSTSLAVAMQLMLFPETPPDVLGPTGNDDAATAVMPAAPPRVPPVASGAPDLDPVRADALAAARQLFAEPGYYGVAMRDIATAADISRATLYRHFSNKDAILAELTRQAVREIESHAGELQQVGADAFDTEEFSEWLLGYVRLHRRYRGVILAWFDGTVAVQMSDAAVEHGLASMHRAVTALLARVPLSTGVDRPAAAVIFLAVLGRMSEPTEDGHSHRYAADLIARLLRRWLLRSA